MTCLTGPSVPSLQVVAAVAAAALGLLSPRACTPATAALAATRLASVRTATRAGRGVRRISPPQLTSDAKNLSRRSRRRGRNFESIRRPNLSDPGEAHPHVHRGERRRRGRFGLLRAEPEQAVELGLVG